MIRFKVFRGSRLLLLLAVLLLAAVAGAILLLSAATGIPQPDRAAARLVDAEVEAEALEAFASSDSLGADVVAPESAVSNPAASVLGDAPTVLIYHTHTHEAYEQVSGDPYEALEAWRTADSDHSVVRVGEALAGHLRAHGFEVVHDTTDHEGDSLSTAYTRSLETLRGYDRAFDLYIDLHRDAYSGEMPLRTLAGDGTACAQAMLLIGNGEGFEEKPFTAQNLLFAKALTRRINRENPGLCREVLVKDGRYNQHIGVFSLLIEVGHNRNTLEEALNTTQYIADAIYSLLLDDPDPAVETVRREAQERRNSQ